MGEFVNELLEPINLSMSYNQFSEFRTDCNPDFH